MWYGNVFSNLNLYKLSSVANTSLSYDGYEDYEDYEGYEGYEGYEDFNIALLNDTIASDCIYIDLPQEWFSFLYYNFAILFLLPIMASEFWAHKVVFWKVKLFAAS